MPRALIDARLLSKMPAVFPSRATVQQFTPTRSATGAVIPGWATLAGHDEIPCRIAPASAGRERRTAELTISVSTHRVVLAGRYTAIRPEMRVLVDDTAHDILAVNLDGQGALTALDVRTITPAAEAGS